MELLDAIASLVPNWMIWVLVIFIIILVFRISELKFDIKKKDERITQINDREHEIAAREDQLKIRIDQLDTEFANRRISVEEKIQLREKYLLEVQNEIRTLEGIKSNIIALPYLAGIFADFETRGLEVLAQQLDWGSCQERKKKVKSIRELRIQTKAQIAQYKTAQYQLEYAIRMFPALEDFLDTDYGEIAEISLNNLSSEDHDAVRNFLSKEEYYTLSTIEKNQLALDRYWESHQKSKWQVGRDYELYIGYRYEKKGYKVDYCGSRNKLEDLGRDLIATKGNSTLIVQCKYWSAKKQIHEKHINQLYGTMMCYCFENNVPVENVKGVLVTNITLSETAKKFAAYLGIEIAENVPLNRYPCIKCNINRSHENGTTHIYHLPFDQMYDACEINAPGEFMAMTVAEAEAAGFRRAYRWYGNS